MHRRMPGTLKSALTIIKNELGAELMAQTVSKTTSLMQKWANPEEAALPNIAQALALDMACLKQCNRAPVLEIYEQMLGRGDAEPAKRDVNLETLDVMHATGRLASVVRDALRAKSGISPNAAAEILGITEWVNRELSEVEEAVRPFVAH